jgi:hypothetical protein
MKIIRGITVCILVFLAPAALASEAGDDAALLLEMHREVLEAHRARDVTRLLAAEPDEIVTVGRGEVSWSNKKDRIPMFERYLGSTEFTKYRDMIDPVVRVSDDGTLGWVIVQVEIAGVRTSEDGVREKFESQWGWIELYEKRDGRWYRTGTVSNRKAEQ